MTRKVRIWQWPNLLALDAVLVAVAWLWVFAINQSQAPGLPACLVLGMSVWLTYTADRLFDVRPREPSQLLSARHQFAWSREKRLWLIWAGVLVVNIAVAFTGLDSPQLDKGFILLIACLAYTALNQLLSARFFPKELLVALIFAGGTQIFLPDFSEWISLISFTLLCLINCLMISWKEASFDARLKVRSLTSLMNEKWAVPLLAATTVLSQASDCRIALLPSSLSLILLWLIRTRTDSESYRVLCDVALLTGPVLYFFGSGVFVR